MIFRALIPKNQFSTVPIYRLNTAEFVPQLARLGTAKSPRKSIDIDNVFQNQIKLRLLNLSEPEKQCEIDFPLMVNKIQPIRQDLIHSEVLRVLASKRSGTATCKGRGEVSGSGRKIHPQKGTGKARAGSIRAPQRRGGGVVFGPKPRSFAFKLNRKHSILALNHVLLYKIMTNGIYCFKDDESLAQIKNVRDVLKCQQTPVLVLTSDQTNRRFVVACRQTLKVTVLDCSKALPDITDYLKHKTVMVSDRLTHKLNDSLMF